MVRKRIRPNLPQRSLKNGGISFDLFSGNNAAEFLVDTLQQLLRLIEPLFGLGIGLVALQLHQLFFDFRHVHLNLQGVLIAQIALSTRQ
jgi:hypothetical protein